MVFPFVRKRKASKRTLPEAIRNIFGYCPRNIPVYELAFRHKSAATEHNNGILHCNERLEYLGDAVLGSVVADFLFKKFPFRDEGFLTEMRSRIVSRDNLNLLSRRLGLDKLVQASKDSSVPGSCIVGDAFEAFIGAVYLDRGYAFTRQLIIRKIIQTHLDIDQLMEHNANFKSRVIEWAQKEKKKAAFRLVHTAADRRKGKRYTIVLEIDGREAGRGEDYSIKRAEQHASRQAWETLAEPPGSQ